MFCSRSVCLHLTCSERVLSACVSGLGAVEGAARSIKYVWNKFTEPCCQGTTRSLGQFVLHLPTLPHTERMMMLSWLSLLVKYGPRVHPSKFCVLSTLCGNQEAQRGLIVRSSYRRLCAVRFRINRVCCLHASTDLIRRAVQKWCHTVQTSPESDIWSVCSVLDQLPVLKKEICHRLFRVSAADSDSSAADWDVEMRIWVSI